MGAVKKYTKEQEAELKAISRRHKSLWSPSIKAFCQTYEDRKYGSVWQKVYSFTEGKPTKKKAEEVKPKKKKKRRPVKKKKQAKKQAKKRDYKRIGHRSPLKGTHMIVNSNELRFPIDSIRIEGGELIVTFK